MAPRREIKNNAIAALIQKIATAVLVMILLSATGVSGANDDIDLRKTENFYYDVYYPEESGEISSNYDKAVSAFEKKDIRKALFYLNNMIKYSQFSKEALNLYGILMYFSGEYENAIDFFRKSINADKKYKCPYINMGLLYIKHEKWRELESVANRYLKIDEYDFEANLGMGIAAFQLNCYKDAEDYFDRAAGAREKCLKPDYIEVLNEYRARAKVKNRRLY